MARIPSVFYQQANSSPIGDAIGNFTRSMIALPGPDERAQKVAQARYYQALTDQAHASVAAKQQQEQAATNLGDAIRHIAQNSQAASDPALVGWTEPGNAWADPQSRFNAQAPAIATANAASAHPQPIGDVYRSTLAVIPDASPAMQDRFLAASGHPITLTEAKGRDYALNADNLPALPVERRVALGAQPNDSQEKALIVGGLPATDQRTFALGPQAFGPTKSQIKGGILRHMPLDKQQSAVLPQSSSAPREASNAQITQARKTLERLGLNSEAIRTASQPMLPNGMPNPDYQPRVGQLVTLATKRLVGVDDPGFEDVWNRVYGTTTPKSCRADRAGSLSSEPGQASPTPPALGRLSRRQARDRTGRCRSTRASSRSASATRSAVRPTPGMARTSLRRGNDRWPPRHYRSMTPTLSWPRRRRPAR